ncbi:hypothetical protein AB0G95_21735 [Streptomyces virginiae]|uniref:hypothetical protein n=1 Tax=Streptomyces virginiae TaxID=1961 RepID=UPI00341DF620
MIPRIWRRRDRTTVPTTSVTLPGDTTIPRAPQPASTPPENRPAPTAFRLAPADEHSAVPGIDELVVRLWLIARVHPGRAALG